MLVERVDEWLLVGCHRGSFGKEFDQLVFVFLLEWFGLEKRWIMFFLEWFRFLCS